MKYESLTKENFWNALMEQYPERMKHFCAWIDEYKKRVEWDKLFNIRTHSNEMQRTPVKLGDKKFHDLPVAMQLGIFFQYACEVDHNALHLLEVVKDTDEAAREVQMWFKAYK